MEITIQTDYTYTIAYNRDYTRYIQLENTYISTTE